MLDWAFDHDSGGSSENNPSSFHPVQGHGGRELESAPGVIGQSNQSYPTQAQGQLSFAFNL